MNAARSPRWERQALPALLAREFRVTLINRYFQVFGALAIMGGGASILLSEDAGAAGFFLLQIVLYFVSLFALLAGVGSAQAEREEWQLLFSQPVPRPAYVIGKFLALYSIFGAGLLLLFLPVLFAGSAVSTLAPLFGQTLMLVAVFLAGGLGAGFVAHDRAQALMIGVSAWLLLLVGIDFLALFAARWPLVQSRPDIWVASLMFNPLDCFRVEALFAFQQIPAEVANQTPLAHWWIGHAGIWFVLVSLGWTGALICLAGLRLNHWEE